MSLTLEFKWRVGNLFKYCGERLPNAASDCCFCQVGKWCHCLHFCGQESVLSLLQERYFPFSEQCCSSYQKLRITSIRCYTVLLLWIIMFFPHCFLNYICSLWDIGKCKKKKAQRWQYFKNYPLFYHSEIGTDTICLRVNNSTVLTMHICTHTNRDTKLGNVKLGP